MSIEPEQMVWACALKVLEVHGDHAPLFVSARIGELPLAGDMAGVAKWKSIAVRLDRLAIGKSPIVTH